MNRTMALRALVVDDDREMRQSLEHLLDRAGWLVESCSNGLAATARISQEPPDVILSDVRMPKMGGMDLLEAVQKQNGPPVVLISAHGDIPSAVAAMQNGAYSYLEKPFDPRRLLTALQHAAEQWRLARDADRLRQRLSQLAGLDRVLLGDSPAIIHLRDEILSLADSAAPVLLLGPTGTGKELVAHAIHDLSPRAQGPFVAVNCATLAQDGFEEAMFGPEGVLTRAHGGTLFLDEVGTCPPEVQARLLRILEMREGEPNREDRALMADVRFLSASNEDLDAAVEQGGFRQDFLFRLNTFVLNMPPLSERKEDIPVLFAHFVAHYGELYETPPPAMSTQDNAALLAHGWPGNVRELRHVAERRLLQARAGRGSVHDAIHGTEAVADMPGTLREAVASFERLMIAKALKVHGGQMDNVAEALGIGRRTLNEKIVKLGLSKDQLL